MMLTVFGINNDSSVSGKAAIGKPSACPAATSSESVKPIHASPRPTNFTTTELPSTRKGRFAWSARHQFPQFVAPHFCRSARKCGKNGDRKSTRLNSSHLVISYAVFCLKKKKK